MSRTWAVAWPAGLLAGVGRHALMTEGDTLCLAGHAMVRAVIDPERTRDELVAALRIAAMVPCDADYRTGVLQT